MHRIFLIPEVVQRIIQHIDTGDPTVPMVSKKIKQTLLKTALTCHSFSVPALDALWYSIGDLVPLFKLLSNFEVGTSQKERGLLWGSIPEHDLRIFNVYASYVRAYVGGAPDVDTTVYVEILKACNRSCLLPNLQYLCPLDLDTSELHFLVSPRLRLFKYRLYWQSPVPSRAAVNLLQNSSPDLVVLDLRSLLDSRGLSAISSFKRLERLILDCVKKPLIIDIDFFRDMPARQTLRSLDLKGEALALAPTSSSSSPSSSPVSHAPNSVDFPALEDLSLACQLTPSSLTTFLGCSMFPVLKSLRIRPNFEAPSRTRDGADVRWQRIFDIVETATTPCLKALELEFESSRLPFIPTGIHVLSNRHLTTFKFANPLISDFDVAAIIKALPLLVHLSLLSSPAPPIVQFFSLISIAVGLPHLKKLELSSDCRTLPDLVNIPVMSHQLEELMLSLKFDSTPEDATVIVQSVDRLFPKLKLILVDPTDDEDSDWCAQDIIHMLQRARNEELIRMIQGFQ